MTLLTILALSGCQSRLTGNEGNFEFAYWADDDVVDFNKPIAVGASLDIYVSAAGDDTAVVLTAATTDDASVMEVSTFRDDTVTVKALADGNVLLSVEGTTTSGETLPDSINLNVRTPEVLNLWHPCTNTGGSAAYLVNTSAWVPFDMEMTNGQSVIGYGYYPVSIDTLVTLDSATSNATWLVLDTGSTAGTAVVSSTIDDTAITMEVVQASAIDGAAEPVAFVLEDIDVGDTNSFYVYPKVGDLTVCQADTPKTVVSDTPDICDVRDADAVDPNIHEYGWFEIEGVAAGTCQYTVTFTDGAGGAGASAQFSYEIEP